MRGPKPIPTELKVVRGTDQKCRRPSAPPDTGATAMPACPKDFDDEERAAWRKLAKAYKLQNRLVQPSELRVHRDWIKQQVQADRSERDLAAVDRAILEADPEKTIHDAVAVTTDELFRRRETVLRRLARDRTAVTKTAAELGLTPSARSRAGFAVPKAQKTSPWGNLGKERGG